MGIASTAKRQQREREADVFDHVADQIESGDLVIYGAGAGPVRDRLRDKARRSRAGERVLERRTRPRSAPPAPDDLDTAPLIDAED